MKRVLQRMKNYILILMIAFVGVFYFSSDDSFAKTLWATISGGDREDLSDNDFFESDVSGSKVSGSDVSDSDVSGSDVSGSDISGSDLSAGDSVAIEEIRRTYSIVTDSYFDDALFIGDSRTVGLSDYAKMDNATFYASTGLSVYKMFKSKIATVEGSKTKVTIEEALEKQQFGKIYIMVGINELGTGTAESFKNKYSERIERIKELQPDAIIYIQSIMMVTNARSNRGDYICNEEIMKRNSAIAELADSERVFYLEINEALVDESGGLNPDYTFDGVHLKAAYVDLWKNYLYNHAIVTEE